MSVKETYGEKLKNPKWQKRRLEILSRDGFKCVRCDCTERELHVHHKKYSGDPWEATDDDLETLCNCCHAFEEYLKKFHSAEVVTTVLLDEDVFELCYRFISSVRIDGTPKLVFWAYFKDTKEVIVFITMSESTYKLAASMAWVFNKEGY